MLFACAKTVLCVFKYYFRYNLKLMKNEVDPDEFLPFMSIFYTGIAETILSAAHPSFFLRAIKFTTYNSEILINVTYSLNEILELLNIAKFVHQLLEMFTIFRYNNMSVQRINKISNSASLSWWSPLKNFITNASFDFMVYTFVISMFLFSGSALILERPVSVQNNGNFLTWQQSLWFTIITMMTIGYGDIKPNSTSGKFLIMVIVIWGNFLNSLFLATIVPFAQLSIQEEKAHNLHSRLKRKQEMLVSGAHVVTNLIKYNRNAIGSNVQCIKEDQLNSILSNINDFRSSMKNYCFLFHESIKNFHDILAKMESNSSVLEAQSRRAKTLHSVILNILARLRPKSDDPDEGYDFDYDDSQPIRRGDSNKVAAYEDLVDAFKNVRRGSSIDSSEMEIQELYMKFRKSENNRVDPDDNNNNYQEQFLKVLNRYSSESENEIKSLNSEKEN